MKTGTGMTEGREPCELFRYLLGEARAYDFPFSSPLAMEGRKGGKSKKSEAGKKV